MSAALDPLDPADFRVMRDALDEWGRARLLDRVCLELLDGGPVSVCTQVRSHRPTPPRAGLSRQYGPASRPADAGPPA